jgi:hypothetical protein
VMAIAATASVKKMTRSMPRSVPIFAMCPR